MGVSRRQKTLGVAVALVAGASAALLAFGDAILATEPVSRAEWQKNYRRPAEIPFPKSNPYSEPKAKLGKILFFDPILSGAQVRSCATCHNPGLSWGDGRSRAMGEAQKPLSLRSPTLLNIAWIPKLGWDGHFRDLESVAMGPITGATNMNLPENELVARLAAIPGYIDAFNAAFGEGLITRRKLEFALATYQRTIVSAEAPFDRWIAGDEKAIGEAAKRGFDLFNSKANCASCHSGWAFTDASFHDIGSATKNDTGRGALFASSVKLQYAFKTPTLRDVARRAPYMHDGSIPTLDGVLELYDRGGIDRPSRSDEIRPLNLSKGEKADLIAFLQTLSATPHPYPLPTLPR
jgi:cytochrome c peroxidase